MSCHVSNAEHTLAQPTIHSLFLAKETCNATLSPPIDAALRDVHAGGVHHVLPAESRYHCSLL